jgi:hypothetical protein
LPNVKAKSKPKLTTARYAERFAVEKAVQQRRYCDAFEFWRQCARSECRREQACRGNPSRCLRRGLVEVPRELHHRARGRIVQAMPVNLGGPECLARQMFPLDFYDGSADRAVIAELKRLGKTGTVVARGDSIETLRLELVAARNDEKANATIGDWGGGR